MLRTRENSDVFNSRDEIYLLFTLKKQISSTYLKTIPTAVAGTLSVGEIAGNDTDANIAVGETKRILCSLVIPDESIYDLKVSVTIPAADVGKLEIGDAAIFSAGENLPCIDTNLAPTITSVYVLRFTRLFEIPGPRS